MKKKLKAGVIGLGMGRGHIAGYQSHPNVTVAAIADPNKKRLAEVGNQYKITKRYTSPEEMLTKEKLDIVSVATPNKFHKPLTLAAFEAGCHVLCEKPMAMNASECRTMLAAAKKAKRRLMINFSYRFTEQGLALRYQVDTGFLGEVYFGRTIWHRRRGMPGLGGCFGEEEVGVGGWFGQKKIAGGGPLIDLGVHRLDLALWLMDYPQPVWVMGSTYNPIGTRIAKQQGKKFDVEDLAVGMIKFDSGATLEIEASWASNISENELMETRLLGTEGGLVHRNLNGTYEFEAEMFVERAGAQYDMKLHPPLPAARSSYHHFADCILNDKPHIATGEEGMAVMKIIDAIYASTAKGEPIKIET